MNASRFLDTNILLYAYDLDAPAQRAAALRLVERGWTAPGDTAISVKVLEELHVNLFKRGISQTEANRIVRDHADWPVVDNTMEVLQAALNEQHPAHEPRCGPAACILPGVGEFRRGVNEPELAAELEGVAVNRPSGVPVAGRPEDGVGGIPREGKTVTRGGVAEGVVLAVAVCVVEEVDFAAET